MWRVVAVRTGARNREAWPWVALSLVGIAGALGGYNPLYLLAVRLGTPGLFTSAPPHDFLALFVLGSAVLAATVVEC